MIIEHNHYYIEGKFLHMKVLVVSLKNRTVYNFRGDLIKEIISKGHEVIVAGPDKIDVEKIYIQRGEREGSITMLVAMAIERKIPVLEVERQHDDKGCIYKRMWLIVWQ